MVGDVRPRLRSHLV
jgi:hypothetical protein